MASSISSIGVGSGLPLDTLLSQLRTAENAPLAALQTRANKEQQRFSAYGTLKSALDAVSSAAEALGKSETFHGVKASVSGDSFTATTKAGSGAIPGTHSILVENLAQAQVLASGRVSAEGDTPGDTRALAQGVTGDIKISFKVSSAEKPIELSVGANASLRDIAQAINADADLKFSASIMNDGDGHRLVISSNETGKENTITAIKLEDELEGSLLQSALEFDINDVQLDEDEDGNPIIPAGSMSQTVEGKNAQLKINGIAVTSQSNKVEDAVEGVTITLNKAAAAGASPDTLSVTRDDSVTTTAVNNFVNAYNALQSTIKSLTSYDIDAQQGAALTGDSLARNAQSRVREAINGLAANGVTLSSIGITTDTTTGNLKVDSTKLNEALTNNRANVEQLFTSEAGLSQRVKDSVEVFTKSDGLIKSSQDSITRTLKLLEGQYEQMEARIDQKMETYRMQFVQLDTFMSQMNGISSYLTSQLSMLENLSNSSKPKS